MNNSKIINLNILIISAVVICFEIISTRISSVIFVQNYAFIILSLSILGLGCGGIFSFYKFNSDDTKNENRKIFSLYITLTGFSLVLFVCAVILFLITNPLIYFTLLFIPFFFAGIVYSEFFKKFANSGYKIYAADLIGAALGSILSIFIFNLFNAPNVVLFLAMVLFFSAADFLFIERKKRMLYYLSLSLIAIMLIVFGKNEFLGKIPIGNFPEKDFYHILDNSNIAPGIVESRWSINGRSDLVEFENQKFVKHLLIDGAAGTQMYEFNGNIEKHDKLINDILVRQSTTIPLLFLKKEEKENMLVIGPGGGKEILTGLLSNVKNITGIEINPDFVDIVKKYKDYNGGIYTDFPNVKIEIAEGRHFIKRSKKNFDVIVLALPSTEQMQIIDGIASNENYLLTVEAIKDYLKILTQNGQMIFTVHNKWELVRLIVTTLYALKENGINYSNGVNHFLILGEEHSPTLVIKKSQYKSEEINNIIKIANLFPADLPKISFLPIIDIPGNNQIENILLKNIKDGSSSLEELIAKNSSDISPVLDDSPYFYKVKKGIPDDLKYLLFAVFVFAVLSVLIPLRKISSKQKKNKKDENIFLPLFVFISIGFGFMVLEIALLQKFILYLGSPTIALSILLGSLLVGMGIGSFFGAKIIPDNIIKRLKLITGLIVATGVILFFVHPLILNPLLFYGMTIRAIVSFVLLLPFGLFLGIPFPTAIQLLKQKNLIIYIPWMYGVNGIFSVLGSVSAVILSMIFGFTLSFFTGLSMYLIIFVLLISKAKRI